MSRPAGRFVTRSGATHVHPRALLARRGWLRPGRRRDRSAWLSDIQRRALRPRSGPARQGDRLSREHRSRRGADRARRSHFGDREGVLVIPAEVAADAIEAALTKASTENRVATAIRNGMGAREAFETFGVL